MLQSPQTKLPKVGTTIFTVMSQLAAERGAVNLGQGFPDFPVPPRLVDALARAMRAGHNQYAMMTGIPALRQAIADKTERVYGWKPDADSEITVTSGATEAIFDAIHAVVRAGEEVIVGVTASPREVFVDRRKSRLTPFHEAYPGRHAGPVAMRDGATTLRILFDRSVVEVFADDGVTVVTDRVFPTRPLDRIELLPHGEPQPAARMWTLRPVWQRR